jgi:anaerobic selenocysteine-containing dehydrogenase
MENKLNDQIQGFCALCWSRCGCISEIKDGILISVKPDPSHPTGSALCAKGKAAPEKIYNKDRILYPMKRSRPKGDKDPGWIRISWDEALDTIVTHLNTIAEESGAESVSFGITTPAGTSMNDGYAWVERFRRVFGSPNAAIAMELCGFSRDMVFPYTFGVPLPMPEHKNSDCIILWGHNPSTTWLAHAKRVADAKARGAKLVVIDPRRVGLAVKADSWLRIKPGTDGALALCLANILIQQKQFDMDFVRQWTNGPFLVREDNGRFLTTQDLYSDGSSREFVAWDLENNKHVVYDSQQGIYLANDINFSLSGRYTFNSHNGQLVCSPAFSLYADLCAEYSPKYVAQLTQLKESEIINLSEMISNSKALSIYMWAGLEMHTNASQTNRAIAILYSLTGHFDNPGGNVILETTKTNDISGGNEISLTQKRKALGYLDRPLGPEQEGWINSDSLYNGILHSSPYPIRALINFGKNFLFSHADTGTGEEAFKSLEFMVHIDMFGNPTSSYADIFLPVCSPWEREGISTDFVVDQEASGLVQFRKSVLSPLGESRSDIWIVLELAKRLGFSEKFWGGNFEQGIQHFIEPSGIELKDLKENPRGINLNLSTRYRKYAESVHGLPRGFDTHTKKVEIYSELFLKHGYSPLPKYIEPMVSIGTPNISKKTYPLILTSGKSPHFLQSQNRGEESLRRMELDPLVELHPSTAELRGIQENDWICIETPHGKLRARAKFSDYLDPNVVSATHGWWQRCEVLDRDELPVRGEISANLNSAIGCDFVDPLGGSVPHKSYVCEVLKLDSK